MIHRETLQFIVTLEVVKEIFSSKKGKSFV